MTVNTAHRDASCEERSATICVFPFAARVSLATNVAKQLASLSGEAREKLWRRHLVQQSIPLTRLGLSRAEVNRLMLEFKSAVAAELDRLPEPL